MNSWVFHFDVYSMCRFGRGGSWKTDNYSGGAPQIAKTTEL
jgi:hypothetical protein